MIFKTHLARVGIVALICFAAQSAQGAILISFEGLPADYVPGVPFGFDIKLVSSEPFAAYNIESSIASVGAVPNVDFSASESVGVPYVFPASANYLAAQSVQGNALIVSLSDFNDPDSNFVFDSVTAVAGVNDRIAHLTISPGLAATNGISLAMLPSTFQLLGTDLEAIPGSRDLALPSAFIPARVPEASTLVLAATALFMLAPWVKSRRPFPARSVASL